MLDLLYHCDITIENIIINGEVENEFHLFLVVLYTIIISEQHFYKILVILYLI